MRSAEDQRQLGVEAVQVFGIAGHHGRSVATREDRHAGIDDVCSPARPADHSRCPCLVQVQCPHVEHAGFHQSGQADLAGTIAPDLSDDARRNLQVAVVLGGELDQSADSPVVALESYQRSGVEDYSPKTCRAHASSSSVAGPFSARISASRSASSSRLAFSSIALSTQALTEEARPAATSSSAAASTSGRTVTVTRERCILSSYTLIPDVSGQHQYELVESLVASGRYQNASEVLREGLRLLEQRETEDAAKLVALREAADRGWTDLASGSYEEIADDNLDDFIGQLGVRAATRTQSAG